MTTYFAAHAQLPIGISAHVRIEVTDGRFTAVTPGAEPAPDDEHLDGVVIPGMANTHSHAFHRALRGRTHVDGSTFWTWRDAMYAIADRLTPDKYGVLARAVYAEMVLAGITTVGEFHYVHHRPDGTSYGDPNAMGHALIAAAADAGLRLTLLDTCYLTGGLGADGHLPLTPQQRRFSDGTAPHWAARTADLNDTDNVRVGAAIHSVRAVPADQLAIIAAAARHRPLHVHLSEQPTENEQCLAHTGLTPTALLFKAGALGSRTTAVHATHLTGDDIALLSITGTTVSLCPTTERDLADGIGPARALAEAGVTLTLGTDQNAAIDLFEEARAVEMHERLTTGRRGTFTPAALNDMTTGHASLGWPDAGRIQPGARADLVEIDPATPRTAGAAPDQLLYAATAADVRTVIIDGHRVVENGRHRLGNIGALLTEATGELR